MKKETSVETERSRLLVTDRSYARYAPSSPLAQFRRQAKNMIFRTIITLVVFTIGVRAIPSPQIIELSTSKVEIHLSPLRSNECFPDRSAFVRFSDDRVVVADISLYPDKKNPFSEGLTAFKMSGKWGACDTSGLVVIKPQFDRWFEFSSGLAGVIFEGRYGFIDSGGKWVVKPLFDPDYPHSFVGDVCPVRLNGKNAIIDRAGNFVWPLGLLRADPLAGGIYIELNETTKGFLDDKGSLIPNGEPNSRYFNKQKAN